MAKRPGPGKCVHCLADPVERNWDHVFPASWYPDTTPPNLSKWQIPSCIPCNDDLGVMEDDLFVVLGHVLDPYHPGSSGLYERAKRAIDPESGKDERDRRARAARRRRFLQNVLVGDAIPAHGVYPGLGDRWNQPRDERMAILFPKVGMERMTEKIVRGIFFIEDEAFIEPPYEIEFFALGSEGEKVIRETVDQYGKEYARGPGIVVRRAVAGDDGKSALFQIEFFQQFKAHASVMIGASGNREERAMGKALRIVVAVVIAAVIAGMASMIGGLLGLPRGLVAAVAGLVGLGVGMTWLQGEETGRGKGKP